MKIIVTCGPGSEPIDDVRRITNFSTGELGVLLANALTEAKHEVVCYRGSGATSCLPFHRARVLPFVTSEELLRALQTEAGTEVGAVFHAAALSDFIVSAVRLPDGTPVAAGKIPSRHPALALELRPAFKILPKLRGLFPRAVLVGWKYELDGTREETVAKGREQTREHQTNACVLNGRAYGPGFGVLNQAGELKDFSDKSSLCRHLAAWVSGAMATG